MRPAHLGDVGQVWSVQIIDLICTDRTSEEEAGEAFRYLGGVWQTRLVTMKAQGYYMNTTRGEAVIEHLLEKETG